MNQKQTYIDGMKKYTDSIHKLQKKSPEEASAMAKEALIRTGVLTKKGTEKKNIVSWS